MIISVVAAKIWYLKNVRFLMGHPVHLYIKTYRQTSDDSKIDTYTEECKKWTLVPSSNDTDNKSNSDIKVNK